MPLRNYDYIKIQYPLPFIEYCINKKDLALSRFFLYGTEGAGINYLLTRDGILQRISYKEKPILENRSGQYVIENALFSYRITFLEDKLQDIKYSIKSDPIHFGIPKLVTNHILESNLLENVSEECLRLSKSVYQQISSYRRFIKNPSIMDTLQKMSTIRPIKYMKELPYARGVTLYDLVLAANSVGVQLNFTVDRIQNKQAIHKLENVLEKIILEKYQQNKTTEQFIQVMEIYETFFSKFNQLKKDPNFIIDPKLFDIFEEFFDKLHTHVLPYRKAQKHLPL